ncbi:hypothetical protein P3W85_23580 [Cupriavidus basilensis]|uniref:Uncharacterized protein n=1 Tax=Cupriavidus basilensis TaxID=68895 RepID=A0ABT6ATG0_9BURK|nr:hypothetical protein [Cupriavidus basilensis]MDF3835907.1 hypothetical protein [Cupriavidus basilensis]
MNIHTLLDRLKRYDFFIYRVIEIDRGHQIHLGCGIRISVYHNKTILVQGKFIERTRDEALPILQSILPPATKWQCDLGKYRKRVKPPVSKELLDKVWTAMAKR